MSLQRFGKIAIRLVQEIVKRSIGQKIAGNALKKIGIRQPQQFRQTLLRGFRQIARQRAPLLRPFATLHFHQQRLHELDQSRRRGFLHLRRQKGPRDVLERVRHIFGTNIRYNQALAVTEMPTSLDSYEIGNHIASGCNGAVYEARLLSEQEQNKNRIDSFSQYPLAIKLLFNYDYNRPEHSLWREMGPELVPLAPLPKALQGGRMLNIKTLPRTHPNLIKLHTAFVDRMPILPDAQKLYPNALPTSTVEDLLTMQFKEPKTLFMVMKRYRMTLYEYVKSKKRNYWFGRVMLGQLLEAVVYLHQNQICHRDMKSDNILLEFDSDDEVPHLVLSDFGSALAVGDWILPFPNRDTDLGGNLALRAPEVRKARPGPDSVIDYEMADTWAAGTLAYEIFTRRNPFYALLSSEHYSESGLPPLPNRLIHPIKRIIEEMLRINPKQRPKPEVAANVLAISLFRFGKDLREFLRSCGLQWYWSMENMRSTFSNIREKMDNKIGDLVELYSAETMMARLINPTVISSAELQLRATFLSRIDKDELRAGLEYFFDKTDNGGMDGHGFFPQNWSTMSDHSSNNSSAV